MSEPDGGTVQHETSRAREHAAALLDGITALRFVIDARDDGVVQRPTARLRESLAVLDAMLHDRSATLVDRLAQLHDAVEIAVEHLSTVNSADESITVQEHQRRVASCAHHAHQVLVRVV